MAETAARRSFAVHESDWLAPVPDLCRFVFRGDAAARASASAAFGVALPEDACRASSAGGRTALWLGPDEWLLLAPEGEAASINSALAGALSLQAHSLVEVTHRQVALVIRGRDAEWVLESQCPLPLNLRDFPVGMCTRTIFGKAEIVLWRTAPDAFHVEVWRSFADYVTGMLAEVARETD